MIEINLLPLELREKKKVDFSFTKTLAIRSGCIILGSLLLLHLFFNLMAAMNNKKLNSLKKKWEDIFHKRLVVAELTGEATKIDEKIPLIEQLITSRITWSKKLNSISDLVVSGVWLNELTLKREKGVAGEPPESLIIRGSAASRIRDEPVLIARFMQHLKDDPVFSADFQEIELGPIKKRLIKQTEVMDFILNCRFKEDRAQTLLR